MALTIRVVAGCLWGYCAYTVGYAAIRRDGNRSDRRAPHGQQDHVVLLIQETGASTISSQTFPGADGARTGPTPQSDC